MIMTIADIDRELARYRAAADTVSANLLELDRDPNRQLLDTATLGGATAAAWADARTALIAVWDWSARFTTFLDQAAALRVSPRTRLAPGREQQLVDLLTQPSIELTSDEIPLRDRDLLQHRRSVTRCTADELLSLMSDAFVRAKDVVLRIGTAWDDLAPRIASARVALQGATLVDVSGVQQHVDALTETLVADPLAVTADALRELEEEVADVTRSAAAARQLRDEFHDRIRDAQQDLRAAESCLAQARAAYTTAHAKIVDPVIPEPPSIGSELTRGLDHVIALADAGRWHEANDGLEQWHASVRALHEAALASTAASRYPIATRDQLRGRLDAYRAKAHGLGLDEDRDLTEAYERANTALHVAPADLRQAEDLVARYQRAITTDHEPEARR